MIRNNIKELAKDLIESSTVLEGELENIINDVTTPDLNSLRAVLNTIVEQKYDMTGFALDNVTEQGVYSFYDGESNGCKRVYGFSHNDKTVYYATEAQKEYKSLLTSTRSGFDITEKELETINRLASPLIINGLSPYHIKQTYPDKISVSEANLRRMIDKNVPEAKNIDLRDKVEKKPRKHSEIAPLSTAKVGHFYGDYLRYIEENNVCVTEMDCVESRKEENAVLLNLTFPSLSLQLAFIMEYQNMSCVVGVLDMIETSLGTDLFSQFFPLILTDNGSEFADIKGMETSCITGKQRTKVFFCEPNRSDEKGSCENHHKMIRYIIPKGTSLELYMQTDISLMMNHINSYKRKALFGKSAFDLAKAVLPADFLILLGLKEISPDKIVLRPSLIAKATQI